MVTGAFARALSHMASVFVMLTLGFATVDALAGESRCFPGLQCSPSNPNGNPSIDEGSVKRLGPGRIELASDVFWEYGTIEFLGDTEIVSNGHSLAIFAQNLTIEGTLRIVSFREPNFPGMTPGAVAHTMQDAAATTLNQSSRDGRNAGVIKLFVPRTVRGHLVVNNAGEPGKPGAPGRDGADGAPGASGTAAVPNSVASVFGVVFGCASSPGSGASGAPGEPGGMGEPGGNGGRGGDVVISVGDYSNLSLEVSVLGGSGGPGGSGGAGGRGGKGGDPGAGALGCSGTSDAALRTGPNGPDGLPGPPGPAGKRGEDGLYQGPPVVTTERG